MPTIPLSTRFVQPGVVKVYWLPAVANTAALTRAEITAGTDLTPELDDITGWSGSTSFIETKDASSLLRPKLPSSVSLEDSSMTFNGSSDGDDIRGVLTRGDTGFVLFCDSGDATGLPAELFPATVGWVAKVRSLSGDAPFMVRVDFGVTGLPVDVTLPATA